MHRLPNLQLDNPQCMQILWSETAPGASLNETCSPRPRDRCPAARLRPLPALWHPLACPTPVLPKDPPARPMEKKRTKPS